MDKPIKKTSIGGQALIEGILMRGPEKTVIAVRTPDGIITKEQKIPGKEKAAWKKWPMIRGLVGLYESMKMGIDALMYSAQMAEESMEEEEPGWFVKHAPKSWVRWYEKNQKTVDQTEYTYFFFCRTSLIFLYPYINHIQLCQNH